MSKIQKRENVVVKLDLRITERELYSLACDAVSQIKKHARERSFEMIGDESDASSRVVAESMASLILLSAVREQHPDLWADTLGHREDVAAVMEGAVLVPGWIKDHS